jgi:PTS system mannose-specific IIC component
MFNPIQVIILALFVAFLTWHKYNLQMFYYGIVVFCGFFTGLVMGDVGTGMLIGGTMCLMSLGLVGVGGSSVPEYQVGCVAGTAFAIGMGLTGQHAVTTAMTIGVPVAALGTQLDVLGKMSGSFFIHKAMACSDKKDWKGMGIWIWTSQIPFLGLWVLPMVLLMTVGSDYIQVLIKSFPAWLNSGLTVASGMLPALGFAILMRYLPLKKYGYFLLFGFVLAAYLNLSMLAIAMLGTVVCVFIFQMLEDNDRRAASAGTTAVGGDNEDE